MAYTNIDDPSEFFQALTYTGTNTGSGSSMTVTNDGNSDLQPDLVWFKRRNASSDTTYVDSTRGLNKFLYSGYYGTSAEETQVGVGSYDSDGITLTGYQPYINVNGYTYVAWQWKANGGTTASNSNGSITSTVQANTDAGFSIVQYTGTGTAATIGHGLGVAPAMYIIKNRDQAGTNWTVFHKDLTSNAYSLYLNEAQAQSNSVGYWNATSPTSTVFSIKNTSGDVNTNTEDYVVYCFAEKQGYSKFGKYTGNGNADGPFVHTGFKPAFVILKGSSNSGSWYMLDSKRDVDNVANHAVEAQSSSAEYTNYNFIDMLSNGFKLRLGTSEVNTDGNSYIYMAFAENPFVTSTGIPTTAR